MPAESVRDRPRGWPADFGRGDGELPALLRLVSAFGTSPSALHALAWKEGTAAACLTATRRDPKKEHVRGRIDAADPDEIVRAVDRVGGRIVGPHDPEFPPSVLDVDDPPAALFVRGRPLGNLVPRIAMVGARNCTPIGRDVAHDIARDLASAGACIVSGAARGVDAAAHRGALAARGPTIAVLGSGIDVEYPASSRSLIRQIAGEGAVVSEYPPGVRAEPFRFPARNRIVAGLSRAVIVVEGLADSGSKITADHALDIGRDVFAVPGPITNPLTAAPHGLIRTGATLIRGAEDVLTDLGIAFELQRAEVASLPERESSVLQAVTSATLPDAVAELLGMSLAHVVTVLMQLELRGLVVNVGGRYQARSGAIQALRARDLDGAVEAPPIH